QCVNLADDPIRCARSTNAPAAIVSYTSIEKQGVYLYGKNPGWSLAVLQQLVASGRYVITYQDGFNWAVKQVGAPA
ncbi:MAG: hypothetical protein QOF00_926, partial [Pseudonocardiales bacterium]|nr:hypothetical protein [Pseudonocardiales bacterium]